MSIHKNTSPRKYAFLNVFVLVAMLTLATLAVEATYAISNFQFTSTSKSVKMGESVEIPIKISTDKDLQVKGADLWLLFDQTAFEVQNINPGDFFSDSYNQIIGEKLYIAGFFNDTTTVKGGDGTYATIYMTPKKTGTFTLKFDCRGNEYPDTSKINVNPQSPQNIIDCASTSQQIMTISATNADGSMGTVATPTPVAIFGGVTNTPENPFLPQDAATSLTPTPSVLPDSGFFDGTLYYLLSGGAFIGFGGILRKLYS